MAYRRAVSDTDPARFASSFAAPRGFRQAYVHEGAGGVPVVCVHGWPETKRIFWRVIEPLADAGFEVIVPDLRGFGESELGPDGFHDVPAHSHDLYALVHDHLGHEQVVLVGGDLGGPVIQDLALRHPEWVERMVLFNSPLPYDKERMAGLRSRPAREASDYFVRQGTDPDGLAAELDTPEQRRRYIATFYTSRFWAHPGAFIDPPSRRVASAAARSSTSTPSRSPRRPRCGRASAATRASSTPRRAPRRRFWPATTARRRSSSSARRTTCSTPTSTGWRPPSSVVTWVRSCCATAVTSSRGRRRTPSSAARR